MLLIFALFFTHFVSEAGNCNYALILVIKHQHLNLIGIHDLPMSLPTSLFRYTSLMACLDPDTLHEIMPPMFPPSVTPFHSTSLRFAFKTYAFRLITGDCSV